MKSKSRMTLENDILTLLSVKLDQIRHFELASAECALRIEKLERDKSYRFLAHTIAVSFPCKYHRLAYGFMLWNRL